MEHDERLRIARRRAGATYGFFIHLALFIAVNGLLFIINQRAAPDLHWHLFPLGSWALGLTIHGLAVFLSSSGLRERMVEEELKKLDVRRPTGAL